MRRVPPAAGPVKAGSALWLLHGEGDPLLLPVKELVKQEVYTKNSPKNTEIVIAKLGNDAGIIGAAFLGNAK